MATFHVFGVPVTISFDPVPHPDDLADEYKRIYDNTDDASIERVFAIENTMYGEYNLVNHRGTWQDFDDGEEEEPSRGGFWSRLFG